MARDYSKYMFNGNKYNKTHLPRVVLAALVERDKLDYWALKSQLSEVGLGNIVTDGEELKIRREGSKDSQSRYHETSPVNDVENHEFFVSNQWSKEYIEEFISWAEYKGLKINRIEDSNELLVSDDQDSVSSVCLIGGWPNIDDSYQNVINFIEKQGQIALWWSFPLDEEIIPDGKFYMYFNEGNGVVNYRYLVEEYVTSRGNKGRVSPWPDITRQSEVGKTFTGIGKNSEIFKTWFKVSHFERLDKTLNLKNDFVSIVHDRNLANRNGFGYGKLKRDTDMNIKDSISSNSKNSSLNQILYGPPGTGKTYNTVNRVLEIIAPDILAEASKNRKKLKTRFDTAVQDGQVEFVTFHQSFGYEEFVEGLRASSSDGNIHYSVEPGVFKRICKRACETSSDITIDKAMTKFLEVIAEEPVKLKTPTGKEFRVSYRLGRTTISCFPEASDEGRELPANIEHIKSVIASSVPERLYCKSYVTGIADFLKEEYQLDGITPSESKNTKPYVLVIDEINRGNISKIFGELITLIEPSKRLGEKEALTVKLPYSGGESDERFGVPNNLYIIGTMNTADRSLAMMDTALRRRFDFVEMMPQSSLLSGVKPMAIDLEVMLNTMNQRIEYLYDREHTLGHAFFMPVKDAYDQGDEQGAFNELQNTFKNKIIPLLEEYFFEDWEKIRLVLADNQVKEPSLQFIHAQEQGADSLQSLFGSNFSESNFGDSSVKYHLNPSPDMPADAFIKIYNSRVAQEAEQDSDNS